MTGFVILGAILLLLAVTVVLAAFRGGEDTGAALEAHERRDAAIEALRDLELEFRTGKLSEAEYREIRARLERTALEARDEAATGNGEARRDPEPAPEGSSACDRCGETLEGGESFCPACGRAV
ncbi:MAG: hypothetical protein MJB57_08160 [Gemmatimonadetes bacterium]|nr:hypothetical protein [Gemmatimonadota bacterium]